ncbi:hypothetical protein [Aeromicrobium endophyticum]|nr:hypothetical protein [Aeromicrobium endophyticum]
MLQSAVEHYERQQQFTAAALVAGRRSGVSTVELARIVAALQLLAARDALESIDPMLEEQDISAPPVGQIAAASFSGTASDGRPLESLLLQAATPDALDMMVVTQVQDAARQAASVSIAARPHIGYVRMLNPPSCSRCAILAGKFFRYNEGFQRHPRCDCRHIPSTESLSGDLTTDPSAYFDSLTGPEQDKVFTKAGAESIRLGADPTQVVNARRVTAGMQVAGVSPIKIDARGILRTTEGTTRRGLAYQQQRGLRRNGDVQGRLMPESILLRAADRAEAQRMLRLYGYIVDNDAAARGRTLIAERRRADRAARARERRAERRAERGATT